MDGNVSTEALGQMFGAISHEGTLALEQLALPSKANVLDVGTGAGMFAIFLALEGYSVLTGEPDTDTTHYAGKDWAGNARLVGVEDKIRFEVFDASEMPYDSGSFDAVFFFGVLHHVDEAKRAAVMREALRVCKADGAVVLFEPTAETLQRVWTEDPGHPQAADPSAYLTDSAPRASKLRGEMMDIYFYRPTVEE